MHKWHHYFKKLGENAKEGISFQYSKRIQGEDPDVPVSIVTWLFRSVTGFNVC